MYHFAVCQTPINNIKKKKNLSFKLMLPPSFRHFPPLAYQGEVLYEFSICAFEFLFRSARITNIKFSSTVSFHKH